MTDIDFITLMTTAEVASARRGGEIVRQHRTGEKLRHQIEEAFEVGTGLMIGRATAMRAAKANRPRGRPYFEAFAKWKRAFGYERTGDRPNNYFSDCLVIAERREIAEQIVTQTSEGEQFDLGLSGLANRVRDRLSETKAPEASAAAKTSKAAVADAARTKTQARPRVREAADNAEIATLRKELWAARDRLEQLAMFLVDKPPPKAEERPFVKLRIPPLPETLVKGGRPKDVPPQRWTVNPGADVTSDPAFALRKEEFEQWLVMRKEALEHRYAEREAELTKSFNAKVKKAVEAELAKEDRPGRVGEFRKLATKLAGYFHEDRRNKMTSRDWDRAFAEFIILRNLITPTAKGKPKAAEPAAPTKAQPLP